MTADRSATVFTEFSRFMHVIQHMPIVKQVQHNTQTPYTVASNTRVALLCLPITIANPEADGKVPTKAPPPNAGIIISRALSRTRTVLAPYLTTPPPRQPPVTATIPVQPAWTGPMPISARSVPRSATAAATATMARSSEYDRVMRNQTLCSVPIQAVPRLAVAILGSGGESATGGLHTPKDGWYKPFPPSTISAWTRHHNKQYKHVSTVEQWSRMRVRGHPSFG